MRNIPVWVSCRNAWFHGCGDARTMKRWVDTSITIPSPGKPIGPTDGETVHNAFFDRRFVP